MVNTELTIAVRTAEGATKTFDSHAPDPGDRPRGIQFGSQLGSGFYTGSFTLSRAIDAEHTDLHLGDDVRIVLANGDTVYEGWISSLPRSMDTEHSLTVNLSGYMAHTADEPFSMAFVDRDLSQWGPASTGYKVSMMTSNYAPQDPSVNPDATAGESTLELGYEGAWEAPVLPSVTARYDAGTGQKIARMYLYWGMNTGVTSSAPYAHRLYMADVDDNSTTTLIGDNSTLPSTGQYFTPTPMRFAHLEFRHDATPGGTQGFRYAAHIQKIAVYGDHGITPVGATDPKGIAASDVIRYLVGRYCPHLNADGVMDTTYPIGHLVFDESTVYDAMLKVNSFHMLDLACWENRTIHYRQIDLTDWDWEIRHDEVGNQIGLQGDSFENLRNGVVVTFQNVATGTQERLHPDDHPELRDESIDNPANIHGRRLYGSPFVVPFPTTAENALELGRLKLAEDLQVRAPGSFTVTGAIRDRSGQLQPPSKVRSGDRIRLVSSASLSDRPRLIHEVTYSADGASATISVDSTRTVIEALLDRTTTALTAAGLG